MYSLHFGRLLWPEYETPSELCDFFCDGGTKNVLTVGGAVTPLYFAEHVIKTAGTSGLVVVYDINPNQLEHLELLCRSLFMGDDCGDTIVDTISQILISIDKQATRDPSWREPVEALKQVSADAYAIMTDRQRKAFFYGKPPNTKLVPGDIFQSRELDSFKPDLIYISTIPMGWTDRTSDPDLEPRLKHLAEKLSPSGVIGYSLFDLPKTKTGDAMHEECRRVRSACDEAQSRIARIADIESRRSEKCPTLIYHKARVKRR